MYGGITPFLGVWEPNRRTVFMNSFQGYDDAFWLKTHTIKSARQLSACTGINALVDPNGIFRFSDLQTFYANHPVCSYRVFAAPSRAQPSPDSRRFLNVQDDWRVKSNLTLNLGLRYEMTTVPTEPPASFPS